MRKLIENNMSDQIKNVFSNEMSKSGALSRGSDAVMAVNDMIRAISSTNEEEDNEQIIRRPIKTMKVGDLVGKKKMNKPIGKLTFMKPIMGEEGETTEATSAGSAGGYEAPLFSKPKRMDSMFKDEQPKKKVKGGFVYENEETGPNGSGKFEYPIGGYKQDVFKDQVEEKWSEKYKRSIDCNNPKGFSQKAHCQGRKKKQVSEEKLKGGKADKKTFEDLVNKYKKHGKTISNVETMLKKQLNKGIKVEMEHTKDKGQVKEIAMDHLFEDPKYYDKLEKIEKVETKEATSSASSGSYVTPAAWAKSTSKKDWRGASKTQIPGGKFVQVKKKCKTFPYCNQGDIKALNIFENKTLQKIITKVSKEHNISESVIKTILAYEYEKNKNSK